MSCSETYLKYIDSLGAICQKYELGARYITIRHNCDNTFAATASTMAAGDEDRGLTTFGHEYVKEMNRLGKMIGLSHVSHRMMRDILSQRGACYILSFWRIFCSKTSSSRARRCFERHRKEWRYCNGFVGLTSFKYETF